MTEADGSAGRPAARPPLRLALVAPRYGRALTGGAELHVRQLAHRLASCGHGVDVLTTCAVDHHTWRNELPPGVERDGSVSVRRFPVDQRDHGIHSQLEHAIATGARLSRQEELLWMRHGVASIAMEEELAADGHRYDAILAAPYLWGTTYFAYATQPQRTLVIPCLHDEAYARIGIVSDMLRGTRGVLFNAYPEAVLGRQLAGHISRWAVVGLGFEGDAPGDVDGFRHRHGISGPFILSVGRREDGKNLPLLLDYFVRYKERNGGDLKLVQAGSGTLPLPRRPDVIGITPDWAQWDAMYRACTVFCQPSVNESLSIVMMQAWLTGRPVLVHGDGLVPRDHCERANGGLWFTTYPQFEAVLGRLLANPSLREALGENGRAYVQTEYSWPAVLERFHAAVYAWLAAEPAGTARTVT